MNAVSAPPSAAAPAAASAAPTATGNNALPGKDALPADFASMLQALQPTANGPADPAAPEAGIASALAELRKSAAGDDDDGDAKSNPVDIALMLGQLNAQATGPGAGQGAAPTLGEEFSLASDEAAAATRQGLAISTALAQERHAGEALGSAGKDGSEDHELAPTDKPVADPSTWRAAELAQQRSAAAQNVKLDVATPVQSPNWSTEVGQRVVWMARNNVQEAQLSVNPPHLGPIEITLSLNNEHASAHFVSPHAEVRDLLEQALPRLREMLAGAGVQLGQSDVGAQSQQAFQQFFSQQDGRAGRQQPSFRDEHPSLQAPAAVIRTGTTRIMSGNGLVDTFV